MSRQRKNKNHSTQSNGISEFQMLEPRLLLSTTVMYRAGGGTGYTDTPFDDCELDYASDTVVNSWSSTISGASGAQKYGLMAVKNLFTLLPATDANGNTLSITSAQLILTRYNTGSSSDTIYIDRMTSNWLNDAAGSSEADTTWKHRDKSAGLFWAGGGSISASDYTTTNQGSAAWVNGQCQTDSIDITALVKDMYSTSTNDGFIIRTSSTTGDNYYTSEDGPYNPVLSITYDYIPSVTNLVNFGDVAADNTYGTSWNTVYLGSYSYYSGSGPQGIYGGNTGTYHDAAISGAAARQFNSGDQIKVTWYNYGSSSQVITPNISFTDPDMQGTGAGGTWYTMSQITVPAGQSVSDTFTFDGTTQGSYYRVNTNRGTTLASPSVLIDKIELIPTVVTTHTLTVNSGTGDGSYSQGTVVPIVADAAPTGQVFSCWTGDTQYIANVNAASTTFTMPNADDSVTATYSWINRSLTVNNGTGGGTTYHYGQVVNISATPQSNYAFVNWAANSGIGNVNNSSTTFTMPNSDATIYANCSPILSLDTKLEESAYPSYVDVYVDDAQLTGGGDTANGNSETITISAGSGSAYKIELLGVKDLFTQIPQTSQGHSITITSATLHLYRYTGTSADTVTVDRLTNNWMTDAAGSSEADVTFLHRDKSAGLSWASGAFSASDYTTSGEATHAWSDTYNGDVPFDVTSMIQGIYSSGNNYGFVVRTNSTTGDQIRSSEYSYLDTVNGGMTYRPYLEIAYSYNLPTPMHALAVTGGTSSGSGNNTPGYYWENQAVSITANTPGSGQSFNMWIGDVGFHNNVTMLSWANQLVASTTYTMPKYDATIQSTYENTGMPLDWAPRWDYVCNKEFGAQTEPLTYQMFGSTTAFQSDGYYQYVSQNDAYLACQTTLPTTGYIQYGTTTSYGSQVNWTNRITDLHGFYLTGLNNNTTYHYQFVLTDERGNQIRSTDATFTTATPTGAITIAGGHYTTPYTISSPGYYMLTGDVTADYSAFVITASNVTLDFGGHSVVYDNVNYQVAGDNFWDFINNSSCGVTDRGSYLSGVKIYNGSVTQGAGANAACSVTIGYEPIFLHSCTGGGGEIAGITAQEWGTQVDAINLYYSTTLTRFNIIDDRGAGMINRQYNMAAIVTAGSSDHNLVLRTRQNGITASGNNTSFYQNEIYGDSCCTNAGGIGGYGMTGLNIHDNRIFGGGYLFIGVGLVHACDSITVANNFIHLQADEHDNRWPEYGAQSGVNGIRQCWGGTNLNFTGNYIICDGQDEGYARGVWEYQDSTSSNMTYTNNIIKSYMFNTERADFGDGCINITDGGSSSGAAYVTFTNNQLMSNFCNVIHGTDMYSGGCNAMFIGNTITRLGSLLDYRTINYQGGTQTGDTYYDTVFAGGAGFDYLLQGGPTWNFTVGWSLKLNTAANASVTIKDAVTQAVVYTGTANASGVLNVTDVLKQYLIGSSGQTNYSYNIDSFYGGLDHYANGVIVNVLNQTLSL